MKKYRSALLLSLVLSLNGMVTAGCATISFNEKMKNYRDPLKEIRPLQADSPFLNGPPTILYHGRVGKELDIKGKRYRQAQFDGFLYGPGRHLTTLLPPDRDGRARLLESKKTLEGPPTAFLIWTNNHGINKAISEDISVMIRAVTSNPYALLKKHYGYTPEKEEYPVILVLLATDYGREFVFEHILWEKDTGKPRVTAWGWERAKQNELLKDIRWVKRKRALYGAGCAVYPFCVIADLALSPVYLILAPIVLKGLSTMYR